MNTVHRFFLGTLIYILDNQNLIKESIPTPFYPTSSSIQKSFENISATNNTKKSKITRKLRILKQGKYSKSSSKTNFEPFFIPSLKLTLKLIWIKKYINLMLFRLKIEKKSWKNHSIQYFFNVWFTFWVVC